MCTISERTGSRVRFRVGWLLGALLAWAGPLAARAQTDLIRLTSPHFAVITDGPTPVANQLSLELEVFRQTVSKFLGLPREQRTRVNVYVWSTRERFDEFRPPSESKTKELAGFHMTDGFTHVLMVRLMPDLAQTREVMFHEYTHLLTSRLFRRVPVWMNEGLAEVFSTFQVGNRQFAFGGPKTGRIYSLLRDGLMPATELLEVRQDSSAYQHNAEVPRFYASAWILALALTVNGGNFNGAAVRSYIVQSGVQTNRVEAFQRAFGLSLRDASLRAEANFRNRSFPVVTEPFDGATIPARTVESLTAAEVALEQGTLARMVRLGAKAEQFLRQAEAGLPTDARPQEQLGLLQDQLRRPVEARQTIERAIELGSVSSHVYYLAAMLRWNRLAGQSVAESVAQQERQEARRLIEKAIQLDPAQAACHALHAAVLLHLPPGHSKEAEAAARRALQFDPYLYQARFTLAEALVASGQNDDARRATAALLASPIDRRLRADTEALAARLGMAGPAAASAPRPTR